MSRAGVELIRYTFGFLFLVVWVLGAVLAKGAWSTVACIFFFPWSWYLVVEKIALLTGFI
jgi:hypothetical protein